MDKIDPLLLLNLDPLLDCFPKSVNCDAIFLLVEIEHFSFSSLENDSFGLYFSRLCIFEINISLKF